MYKKDDFLLTLPSPKYVRTSKLLKKIGLQCSEIGGYKGKSKEYWLGLARVTQGDPDGVSIDEHGEISDSYLDDILGIRPVLKSPYLSEIINNAKCYRDKHNILVVELGKWPEAQASYGVLIDEISELKFTGNAYPFVSEEYGYEILYLNNKWILYNQKIYSFENIEWYYDKNEDLLLCKNILFSDEIGYYDILEIIKPENINKHLNGNYFEYTPLYKKLNDEVLTLILSTANLLQENTKNQLNANDIVKLKDLLEQQAQLMKALKENKKELCEQTTKRKSYKFIWREK